MAGAQQTNMSLIWKDFIFIYFFCFCRGGYSDLKNNNKNNNNNLQDPAAVPDMTLPPCSMCVFPVGLHPVDWASHLAAAVTVNSEEEEEEDEDDDEVSADHTLPASPAPDALGWDVDALQMPCFSVVLWFPLFFVLHSFHSLASSHTHTHFLIHTVKKKTNKQLVLKTSACVWVRLKTKLFF